MHGPATTETIALDRVIDEMSTTTDEERLLELRNEYSKAFNAWEDSVGITDFERELWGTPKSLL